MKLRIAEPWTDYWALDVRRRSLPLVRAANSALDAARRAEDGKDMDGIVRRLLAFNQVLLAAFTFCFLSFVGHHASTSALAAASV